MGVENARYSCKPTLKTTVTYQWVSGVLANRHIDDPPPEKQNAAPSAKGNGANDEGLGSNFKTDLSFPIPARKDTVPFAAHQLLDQYGWPVRTARLTGDFSGSGVRT